MEKREIMQMVKAIAVLVVISLLAGILLGVVNHFTTVNITADIDYDLYDQMYPAGAGNWDVVKPAAEFSDEEKAANSFDYGDVLLYAKNADGTIIVYAHGTGGFGKAGAYAYTAVGTDGKIIAVKGENGAESYWDSHYVPGRAAFEAQFVGVDIMSFARITVSGDKGIGAAGGNLVIAPVAGASMAANSVAFAVSAGCRFVEAAGLLGELEDPNQPFADAVNAVKALEVTPSDIRGMQVAFTSDDGELMAIDKTGYIVYILEGAADSYIIMIFNTTTEKIETMGVYGYTSAIASADVDAYKLIDMSSGAATDPVVALGDAGARAGVDLAAYTAVKILAIAKGDPDVANKPNREALKNNFPGATKPEFVTMESGDLGTEGVSTLVYKGRADDGTIGYIVETVGQGGGDVTITVTLALYVKDGKIISGGVAVISGALTDSYGLEQTKLSELTTGNFELATGTITVANGATISNTVLANSLKLIGGGSAPNPEDSEDPANKPYRDTLKSKMPGGSGATFYTEDAGNLGTQGVSKLLYVGKTEDGTLGFIIETTSQTVPTGDGITITVTLAIYVKDGKIINGGVVPTSGTIAVDGYGDGDTKIGDLKNGSFTISSGTVATVGTGATVSNTILANAVALIKAYLA